MPYPSILDQRKVEIAAICRATKVAELALFGSAATGDLRSNSDLDFLVEFAPALRLVCLNLESCRQNWKLLFNEGLIWFQNEA